MKMTLAATSGTDQIYFVVDPEKDGLDGVVVGDGTVRYIPFWSYVNRSPITRLTSTELLQELWNGDYQSEAWKNSYFLRTEKIPSSVMQSSKMFLLDVPPEEEYKYVSDLAPKRSGTRRIKSQHR